MLTKPELSLILPAYNEGGIIEETLGVLDRAVKKSGLQYEIVVVDDGSVDNTREKAIRYASKNGHVKVIGHDMNRGKGYAIKSGYVRCAGKRILFVDSDSEINVEKVLNFVDALNQGELIIASKSHPDSVVDMPLVRRMLGRGFNILVRLLTGVKLRDTQTGLKAINRKAFEKIFSRLAVKRYAFDVELLTVASLYDLKIIELPVRIKTNSIFKVMDIWRMFLDLLGISYRLRVLKLYQRTHS